LASALIALASAPFAAPQLPQTVHPPQVPPSGAAPIDDAMTVHVGQRLDPSAYGPSVVEGWDVVLERDAARSPGPEKNPKGRNGAQGQWIVPSRNASTAKPHSGERYVMNQWGDARMGIGFPARVDVEGAWFSGQGGEGLWAKGVEAIGYRGGKEVARSEKLGSLTIEPQFLSMKFEGVDRIEIVAGAAFGGAGWYALDDLLFRPHGGGAAQVIDFDDQTFGAKLAAKSYRGLTWETGTGEFIETQTIDTEVIHPPQTPPGMAGEPIAPSGQGDVLLGVVPAVPPSLGQNFVGPRLGDTGAGYLPPDTCGSVGIDHFVAVVNANISVYVKSTGTRVLNSSLNSFFLGQDAGADPRCVFDPHSQRFIVLSTNFSDRIFIAVSTTSNPTGTWFKTSFLVSQDADAASWPDYPTLGVDQNGIYTSSYMVGGVFGMSIFALDKAPMIAGSPSLGTITAWRQLPWEGAIQPCVTYGTPSGEYLVSRRNATSLRIRRVNPPLTAPTLTEVGNVTIPNHSGPPDVPALGSVAPLDALDTRPMNAVYRNGSVWTAHGISVSSRAAIRWYQINPVSVTTQQVGTISDPVLGYMDGSISVNSNGDLALGFSGSHAGQHAAAYFTGRNAGDPAGATATPILLRAGQGTYNYADSGGSNRWGDYSLTSVDPVDDFTVWTIQEYARTGNNWGTWIGELNPGCPGTPDCNGNGVIDECDINGGFSNDNNANGIPDECDVFVGAAYCFGDGSLPTMCPCGPPDFIPFPSGGPDAGCANSINANGAKLVADGTSSPDTVVFTADIGPNYVGFGFLFKGDATDNFGVALGDGVRCVDGALVRFGAHYAGTNGAPVGQWTYPNTVQTLPVTQATLQVPGQTAHYQLYYRNAAAGFCSPGTTNLTNAFSIDWP
jgi:hypothetical protein